MGEKPTQGFVDHVHELGVVDAVRWERTRKLKTLAAAVELPA